MIRPFLSALALAGLVTLGVGHAVTLHALADGTLVPQLLSPHPGTALEAATAAASLYASRAAVYFGVPPLLAGAAAWRLLAAAGGPPRRPARDVTRP